MANLKLDIIVIPTYNTWNLAVVDASTYPTNPPVVSNPTIKIEVPGFYTVMLPFNPGHTTVYNSTDLEITNCVGCEVPLPDGVYHFTYTVNPAYEESHTVKKTIMRVDRLQEKVDEAFMQLDIMECDGKIKAKDKKKLNDIYFLIQGAVAAANNCANVQSLKLYMQAQMMLDSFNSGDCGCCNA